MLASVALIILASGAAYASVPSEQKNSYVTADSPFSIVWSDTPSPETIHVGPSGDTVYWTSVYKHNDNTWSSASYSARTEWWYSATEHDSPTVTLNYLETKSQSINTQPTTIYPNSQINVYHDYARTIWGRSTAIITQVAE